MGSRKERQPPIELVLMRGTEVSIRSTNIKGVILAVCIRAGNITYDVSYFNNGEHKTAWLSELEFTTFDTGLRNQIGYR